MGYGFEGVEVRVWRWMKSGERRGGDGEAKGY